MFVWPFCGYIFPNVLIGLDFFPSFLFAFCPPFFLSLLACRQLELVGLRMSVGRVVYYYLLFEGVGRRGGSIDLTAVRDTYLQFGVLFGFLL
jgi:hypothetical protein